MPPQIDKNLVIFIRAKQAFPRVLDIENDDHCNHSDRCESEDVQPTTGAGGHAISSKQRTTQAIRGGAKGSEKEPAGISAIEGAVFALFGLLLAFTFSGSLERFNKHRELIAEETNGIGTAYLRLDLLSKSAQPTVRELFGKYLDARLDVYRKLPDIKAAKTALTTSTHLQEEIWTQAVNASRLPDSHPDAGKLLLPPCAGPIPGAATCPQTG